MNYLKKSPSYKIITLVLIGLFLCQGFPLSSREQGENLGFQLDEARKALSNRNFDKALTRLKRLAAACETKGIQDMDIKNKYGQAFLLIGICLESSGESKKAGSYYKQARGFLSYEDFKVPGLDLPNLAIYNKNLAKASKYIAKEREPGKKKKFPWLLVAGAAATAIVLFLVLKPKPKQTLTVSIEEGVEGDPTGGAYSHKKGAVVNYNYTLKSGYTNLVVKIDGVETAASGTLKMDKDHILTASAGKTYTLAVTKGQGVTGTPESGTVLYTDGETVNYNYGLQAGYTDLVVKIDGLDAPISGSIIMNKDHTLTAEAVKIYTLTVTKGIGVIGLPETGAYNYKAGDNPVYNYSVQSGYTNLVVMLDGIQVGSTGTISMTKDRTLTASATASADVALK